MIICAAIKDTRTGAVFGGIRYEAFKHAKACGQLSASTRQLKIQEREIELYSEDLY